ncbi:ABC-type phosphate/phosphonate transport system, permease component [Mycoplasmopsis californica]|uniref:ABC transporter permease subunit n=1 Tax=Mycoplasmopsis equigenitalium TaxID=114883 RepID=A0ABY5J5I8_9BACT|nr:ABC transporter permease subunit [Mycoplasmopsis equigenitalium]UUD37146.1 ABC transporter permease subunit [Mycoplasmopsis equigenitalium]VEU69549.1 ABC-type phosphate/phosphonate transport system, permease component [Mycoplasmopsis californica]
MRYRKHDKENNITFNSNAFAYFVESQKTKTSSKILPIYRRILIFLLVVLIVIIFVFQNYNLRVDNFSLLWERIKNIFVFDTRSDFLSGPLSGEYVNLWSLSFKYLYYTIKYALVGTFIGFILALVTVTLSYKEINNKYFAYILKGFILVLRAIPELVFIRVFLMTFRDEVSLIFVFIWFSWLWLHKYYIELLEKTNLKSYQISVMQGNSKYVAFKREILPRVQSKITALFLYSFESNIKWSSILGALSLPGIGALIKKGYSSTGEFKQLGIPLFVLVCFIIILEIINVLVKKYLFEGRTKALKIETNLPKNKLYTKLSKQKNIRKIILIVFLLLISAYVIYVLVRTKFLLHNLDAIRAFAGKLFQPNWKVLNFASGDFAVNPLLMLIKCFEFSILSLVIIICLTLLFIRFSSFKISNKYSAFSIRIMCVLMRTVPVIVLFYVFKPIFVSPFFLLIILISSFETGNLVKQMTEAVENLSQNKINNLRLQGYSNNQIYCCFVIPMIKKELTAMLIFYFEIVFRNTLTFSVFVGKELEFGNQIWSTLDNAKSYHPEIAVAYIWLGTIAIIGINLGGQFIKKII